MAAPSGTVQQSAPRSTGVSHVGITSTITLANHARDQLKAAVEASDSSGAALDRAIAVLGSADDLDGPLVECRQAVAVWRDQLRSIEAELSELAEVLGRFSAELGAIQQRLSPAGTRGQGS